MSARLSSDSWRALSRLPGALILVCALLLLVSLVVLRSASLTPDGRSLHYATRQLQWAGAGALVFLALALLPYQRVTRRAWLPYALGISALLLVFAVGTSVNGSRRWFAFGSLRVQPSEFMKYALLLLEARLLAGLGERVKTWRGLAQAAAAAALPFLLVLLQPDLGTALTYVPILAAMVFVAGARLAHLGALAAAGLALAPLAWLFVLRDYQKLRVLAFLDPEAHTLGGGYQTAQSIVAVGAGGVLGRGYQQGTQGPLGFVPERHTDFVYSVVCEDFGLVGGLAVLALYAWLLLTLARIAERTRDPEGRLLVTGVLAVTLVQVVVNVSMVLGLAPVTGLTLPLVSYGGSSLVASMIGFGLVASVARSRRVVFLPAQERSRGDGMRALLAGR